MTENGKLYQDQLYGAKVLSPLAVAVIDTPEFQRLSGLRQLGFSDLVYRGARHTRYEHSVGTYFVARRLIRRIVQNHERLDLEHPGDLLSDTLRLVPRNADVPDRYVTPQSRWRGLMEVVSIAALLHDIGHVPYGHTLEDEFTGLYKRHDRLGGSRLYLMLFDESSGLARVFSDDLARPWLERLPNSRLAQLIYLILSWKDQVNPARGFSDLLTDEINDTPARDNRRSRLTELSEWHLQLSEDRLFHPFMSDIVGNTICADLLDYLPRDRTNLGMEARRHTRLQRYLTIRGGSHYENEGHRLSIMVTRKGRGGQRRDVATAVLDIMRERYEMAERVFYHHKKAAAGASLAKLVELAGDDKPRDDDAIYPAPWQTHAIGRDQPHMIHLSDAGLIDYLGTVTVRPESRALQARLHRGLTVDRNSLYRTLLVVDTDLASQSRYGFDYFADDLRGGSTPSSENRNRLEEDLAQSAGAESGAVILYCPAPDMQAKEVDARLEITEGRVLPLRVQRESFAYKADVDVLQQYYQELWRIYLFVSPELFKNPAKCKQIVDKFCERYEIPPTWAYRKVRTHDFVVADDVVLSRLLSAIQTFIVDLPFAQLPTDQTAALLQTASEDDAFLQLIRSDADPQQRLASLIEICVLDAAIGERSVPERRQVTQYMNQLRQGQKTARLAARAESHWSDFSEFQRDVVSTALAQDSGNSSGQ